MGCCIVTPWTWRQIINQRNKFLIKILTIWWQHTPYVVEAKIEIKAVNMLGRLAFAGCPSLFRQKQF